MLCDVPVFLFNRANDGCLYVFDRELNKRTLKVREHTHGHTHTRTLLYPLCTCMLFTVCVCVFQIDAHEDDVNAVAFADASSQLLFSGSDDALCKVWDRRTLREHSPQPVGVLAGHRDGITFIHSKVTRCYIININISITSIYSTPLL